MHVATQIQFSSNNKNMTNTLSSVVISSTVKVAKPQDFNILIVDDEPDLREILSFDFERMGYRVDTAAGGIEALAKFKENRYDLIITDIRMPQGDGLSLLKNLKLLVDVPVICITGFSELSISSILEMGALGVFEKPFDRKKLHTAVFKVLGIETN